MFGTWLESVLRGMFAQRLFSLINLFGLAVGLASLMLIGLYVGDELGYDRYHDDAGRLYRVSRDFYPVESSGEQLLATNAAPAAELLKTDFPEIEQAARLFGGRVLLSRDDVEYYDDAVQFVDPALLELFRFEWLAGDPASALDGPFNIVLSESLAHKYFGDEDPLGKAMELENALPLTVSGVIRDLPANTHLKANALASLEPVLRMFGEQARTSWNENVSYHTYVRLAPGASMQALRSRFPDFVERHIGEGASDWTGMSAIAVPDIHLHSDRQLEMKPPGSMANVLTLITVACGILVIACFNFMNLATAVSALRGREVGVRKSMGARRGQLVRQFLGEALGMTLVATLVAIVIVELLMPAFNGFTGKSLAFDPFGDRSLQAALLVLVLLVTCGAGAYPAFCLSAFQPAKVLRGRVAGGSGDLLFRNLLVVLQFSIAIVLVIVTAVVLLQTNYARQRDPGFTRDPVLVLNGPPSEGLGGQWEAMKRELLAHPDIVAASASNLVPGMENLNSFSVRRAGARQNLDFPLPFQFVDYDFFSTYEVPLLSGRVFGKDFPADIVALPPRNGATGENADRDGQGGINANFMLNASAARDLGWTPEEAIDKDFEVYRNGYSLSGRIVGVVADSNFESIRFGVKPLLFILTPSGIWQDQYPTLASASLRLGGANLPATLEFVDRTWKRFMPDFPASRAFLDDRMNALYRDESRLGRLYGYFSLLAILIACMGLFGLATFNAQRRLKEIGVRKVMGGSAWQIVLLLTNDFSKLVLIANVIAWPVAYVAMNRWLENFAYRIDLTPLIFIGSGLIALCVAWVTVGGTAAKAASRKPVLALRYE